MVRNLRLEALRALRDAIACAVPDLKDRIGAGQQVTHKTKKYPCLNLYPVGWKYLPDQEGEHLDPADDRLVLNMGRHEGLLQMRLSAATLGHRYELEQQLLDFFIGQTEPTYGDSRPGIAVTTVNTIPELGDWIASWELDGNEWRDEKAFDKHFDAIMEVTGIVPALVNRTNVPRMNEIRLGYTGNVDEETTFDEQTFDTSTEIERVQVNEDGTITPL